MLANILIISIYIIINLFIRKKKLSHLNLKNYQEKQVRLQKTH